MLLAANDAAAKLQCSNVTGDAFLLHDSELLNMREGWGETFNSCKPSIHWNPWSSKAVLDAMDLQGTWERALPVPSEPYALLAQGLNTKGETFNPPWSQASPS